MNHRTIVALLLVVGACLTGACSPPIDDEYVSIPVDTAELRNSISLGPGDVFEVRVYGEKDLSGIHRVSGDGSIQFPLIGTVNVLNQSPSDVALVLQDRLRGGYLVDPYVSVVVKEYNSKKIFVLGQVAKPGTFPFEGEMNIVQAITLAGGFTQMARKNNVIVTRVDGGVEKRIKVPVERISEGLAPNFQLKAGDIVFVPERIM